MALGFLGCRMSADPSRHRPTILAARNSRSCSSEMLLSIWHCRSTYSRKPATSWASFRNTGTSPGSAGPAPARARRRFPDSRGRIRRRERRKPPLPFGLRQAGIAFAGQARIAGLLRPSAKPKCSSIGLIVDDAAAIWWGVSSPTPLGRPASSVLGSACRASADPWSNSSTSRCTSPLRHGSSQCSGALSGVAERRGAGLHALAELEWKTVRRFQRQPQRAQATVGEGDVGGAGGAFFIPFCWSDAMCQSPHELATDCGVVERRKRNLAFCSLR